MNRLRPVGRAITVHEAASVEKLMAASRELISSGRGIKRMRPPQPVEAEAARRSVGTTGKRSLGTTAEPPPLGRTVAT